MAADEVMMNVRRIGRSLFQVIYLLILKLIIADVVNARRPESVVASPYEGIRKGSIVIMNMPNPNPVVLWTKLAPKVRRNISSIFSICSVIEGRGLDAVYVKNGSDFVSIFGKYRHDNFAA